MMICQAELGEIKHKLGLIEHTTGNIQQEVETVKLDVTYLADEVHTATARQV